MNRTVDLLATVLAGATGAALAALAVGASLFVVLPVTISVGVIALFSRRTS